MTFAPRPENSFAEFAQTYFRRCRERVPGIEGHAAKWSFEDLVPGLSDLDTRFLVREGFASADWNRMSAEVGRVHLELARERREWARTLEHLPGVNLAWNEIQDSSQYHPEFAKWTFHGGDERQLRRTASALDAHRWTEADAAYHWRVFAAYYGRYDRAIDPPINLGPYENKYPLHSRLLHYFAPPLHAAVCLLDRRTTPGKFAAFRRAREILPGADVIERALDIVASHYERPEWLAEPGLTDLDLRLEGYLQAAVPALLAATRGVDCPPQPTVAELRAAVGKLDRGPAIASLFENVKFARLMKGRLWFYGQDVLWFDSLWLIRNELARIRRNFFETPLRIFSKEVLGLELAPDQALAALQPDILSREQAEACLRFAERSGRACADRDLKRTALEIADGFDPFLDALETLMREAKRRLAGCQSA